MMLLYVYNTQANLDESGARAVFLRQIGKMNVPVIYPAETQQHEHRNIVYRAAAAAAAKQSSK